MRASSGDFIVLEYDGFIFTGIWRISLNYLGLWPLIRFPLVSLGAFGVFTHHISYFYQNLWVLCLCEDQLLVVKGSWAGVGGWGGVGLHLVISCPSEFRVISDYVSPLLPLRPRDGIALR